MDRMKRLPETPGPLFEDERLLVLARPHQEGMGEDSCIAAREGSRVLLAVTDGLGGSGGRTYPGFEGHTGAWVASRASAEALGAWFADEQGASNPEDAIRNALERCRGQGGRESVLLGSLSREFPTTLAAIVKEQAGGELTVCWCGDSRCYVLDSEGLHQATVDDTDISDELENLQEDSPMNNVACASASFTVHCRTIRLQQPCAVFAATDGCFGYFASPMVFERILLETLQSASSMEEWKAGLDEKIGAVSGDDYTMVLFNDGFSSFAEMKRLLGARLKVLNRKFSLRGMTDRKLREQWKKYRPGYKCLQENMERTLKEDRHG